MRNTKKPIAIFIIVCMALTLLPAVAFGATTVTLTPAAINFGYANSSAYTVRMDITAIVTASPTNAAARYVWTIEGAAAGKYKLYADATSNTAVASQTTANTVYIGIVSSTPIYYYETAYVKVTYDGATAIAPISVDNRNYNYPSSYYGGGGGSSSIYSGGWNPYWITSQFWSTPQNTTTQPAPAPAANTVQTKRGAVTIDSSGVANGIEAFESYFSKKATAYAPDNPKKKLGIISKDTKVTVIDIIGSQALIEYADKNGSTVQALVARNALEGVMKHPVYAAASKKTTLYDFVNGKFKALKTSLPKGAEFKVTDIAGGYMGISYNGVEYYVRETDVKLAVTH